MSISFQCTHCGKKLKAPESAAGKTSTCPTCGNKVTCPEPVYDAEVVEMSVAPEKPAGFNPYDDLDEYGVVAPPPPAQDPTTEGRRPCPMCGEMILNTAAKCRYCGEVFDATLKKTKSKKKSKKYASEDESLGIAEVVLAILCTWVALIMGIVWMVQGKPKGVKMVGLVALVIVISFGIGVVIGIVQVAQHPQPGVP
jgi:predicted RNA-binding Zn-ribbon protein involved in translation (DUF1610 family)